MPPGGRPEPPCRPVLAARIFSRTSSLSSRFSSHSPSRVAPTVVSDDSGVIASGASVTATGFEKVSLSEVPNAASGYYHPAGENLHTVIKNRGNLFTIAVSGERETTELIMQEAARR